MTSVYSWIFEKRRYHSSELQKKDLYNALLNSGFLWIRKYNERSFEHTLRNPTLGCIVEVLKFPDVGCIPLDSYKARQLIRKLCY